MGSTKCVESDLRIPRRCILPVSRSRSICLVPDVWLRAVCSQRPQLPESAQIFNISEKESQLLLVASNNKLPTLWSKVSIKCFLKSNEPVHSLVSQPLASQHGVDSLAELMRYLELDIYKGLWRQANRKFADANTHTGPGRSQPGILPTNDLMRETLSKIFNCSVKKISTVAKDGTLNKLSKVPSASQIKPSQYLRNTSEPENLTMDKKTAGFPHSNVQSAYVIVESDSAFYTVQPHNQFKLCDTVMYSPAILETCHSKALFILYQLLNGIRHCHRQGIGVGDVNLQEILVDDKLWIKLIQPSTKKIYQQVIQEYTDETERNVQKKVASASDKYGSYHVDDLPKLTQAWVNGEMTNFDYLMVLNYLSGRRMNDPNNHPILPWVMDFTSPNGNYRDLAKSKFRLNKGDRQLDLTYDALAFSGQLHDLANEQDNAHVGHHISDMLSDITYYVYKARQTPKPVLCAHVRSKWVPHEYPSSMQRMQEWTPDECIPEFFTDPTIFTSIHEDLPDLEIPSWASGVEDFINKHKAVLEGPQVSHRLHHWIDLTFGYKLSGPASVKSKNVCLQLVDEHTDLRNHGVVQLFAQTHPMRHLPSAYNTAFPPSITRQPQHLYQLPEKSSDKDQPRKDQGSDRRSKADIGGCEEKIVRAEEALITLPISYDPVAMLDQLETQFNFSLKATHVRMQQAANCTKSPGTNWLRENIHRDMQALGCLVAELFLSQKLRILDAQSSLEQRYQLIRNVCEKSMDDLPRPVRPLVRYLLQLQKPLEPKVQTEINRDNDGDKLQPVKALFHYEAVSSEGLPPPCPDLLLHPASSVIPFPSYLPSLHTLLDNMHRIQWSMQQTQLQGDLPAADKTHLLRTLAKDRVNLLSKYINKMVQKIGHEGLDLVIAYVIELFDDQWTNVHAAWLLFNPIATALGPREANQKMLSHLISVMNAENTTAKHIKLYHRSFIMQILVRVGLEAFLNHFSTLLVEAAAGYRNFVCEDGIDQQLSVEPEPEYPDLFESGNHVNSIFNDDLGNAEPEADDDDGNGSSDVMLSLSSAHEEANSSGPEEEVFADDISLDNHQIGSSKNENVDDKSISSYDPACEDDVSIGSVNPPVDDAYGQSVGAVSLHSVSRLMSDEDDGTRHSKSEQADSSSPSERDNVNRADELLPDTSIVQNEIHFKSSVTGTEYNISDVASETIKWLSYRLGPVLTAKYLSRNLLRMLALCYYGDDQLEEDTISQEDELSTTGKSVFGDRSACQVLDCLISIAVLYGESVIMLQYFAYARELILNAEKRLTGRAEAGLIACVVLVKHILPYLSDTTLLDNLQEVILRELLIPILRLVSSTSLSYPGGTRVRTVICHKLVDTLYMISLRIGFEMTREHMTFILQKFFAAFNRVYDEAFVKNKSLEQSSQNLPAQDKKPSTDEMFFEVKLDAETKQYKVGTEVNISGEMTHRRTASGSIKLTLTSDELGDVTEPATEEEKDENSIMVELQQTFTAELAHLAYIPFCRLAGGIHMEQNLINDDLIRQLCAVHDEALSKQRQTKESTPKLSNGTEENKGYTSESQTTWFASLDDIVWLKKLLVCGSLQPSGKAPTSLLFDFTWTTSKMIVFQGAQPNIIGGCVPSGPNLLIRDKWMEDFLDGRGVNAVDLPIWYITHSDQRTRSPTDTNEVSGNFGKNVSVAGNRITITHDHSVTESDNVDSNVLIAEDADKKIRRKSAESAIDFDKLKSPEMEMNKQRHLKGNWLAYWEHEIGLSERETAFNFKQIKLQTFSGHTGSVRSICILDNENSFISASKDKTVKLWSLRSFGDGMGRVGSQWSYPYHKKSVFSVTFLESMRLAASCDSAVHVWDPFVGMSIRQFESPKNAPVTVLSSMPAPSTLLVTATTDAVLRFLDVRKATYTHDFKCSTAPAGLMRCVTASPDGNWVAVGYSSGIISVMDTRTGLLLASWKGHEGELLQIKAFNKKTLVTSSFDQCVSVWNVDEAKLTSQLKGIQEPVHCMGFYKGELVSATTANRIGVHTSLDRQASFSSTKLRSDVFRGVLTTMTILPLNKLLLLGADNGSIKLLA